ncbi:MAG TPA: hypothetical protein VFP56_09330 [Candidatus Limnocylindrales bacterium]|nr:hypothetical protein [Candidatus Limnocylindrales bacterium]
MVVTGARGGVGTVRVRTVAVGVRVAAAVAVLLAVVVVLAFAGPQRAAAINLTQAEAPIPVLTADPQPRDVDKHLGAGDGVVDADTTGPAQVESSNNVVFLIAALGVLIGVLIVARPRRGPKS